MKIGLISPRGAFFKRDQLAPVFNTTERNPLFKETWSGIGAALPVVAALTPPTYDIEIIDENMEEIDFDKEYDIVGITLMTQQAVRAYEIAAGFREKGVHVVLGGIHVTTLPEETEQHGDTIIIGEAEFTWPLFLKDFASGKPQKRYHSENLADLSELPPQRFDLIQDIGYRSVWLQTTRGCPHDCEFCAAGNILGKEYRIKPVPTILKEIDTILELFGPDIRLNFSDDNLFVNRKFAKELLEGLKKRPIKWHCLTDISIAESPELLEDMYEAGCVQMFIGFESLSGAKLDQLNSNSWKSKKLKKYPEYIKTIQSYGLSILGAFIIGFDHDDHSTFDRIIEFIKETCILEVQISMLTPLPGTPLRERFEKAGRLLPLGWDYCTFSEVVFAQPFSSMR